MKLTAGVYEYDLPPIGEVHNVLLRTGDPEHFLGHDIVMTQVYVEHLSKKGREDRGVPVYFAIFSYNPTKIRVWPTPDRDYTLIGRYYPPIQEF